MNGVMHLHVVRDQNKPESIEGDKPTMMNGIMRLHVVQDQNKTESTEGDKP